jgi:hypothetical protein
MLFKNNSDIPAARIVQPTIIVPKPIVFPKGIISSSFTFFCGKNEAL